MRIGPTLGDPLESPLYYVNHVDLQFSGEDVFMTLYTRYDNSGQVEGDEYLAPVKPLATVVTNPDHAVRWAKLILRQVDEETEDE